jgi:hypothetical protein
MKKQTPVRKSTRPTFRPRLETFESRLTPTTYTVSSLADSGPGSLRAAITSVNGDTTGDEIDFSVAGVIQLTSSALPALTNGVIIDGTTAPGFAGSPVVEIDSNGFAGLTFGSGVNLISLSIVNANGAGVTLESAGDTVIGNYIGLALGGAVAGNTGTGLLVNGAAASAAIGGTTAADRNVISGNGGNGIQLGTSGSEQMSQQALIEGNFIGTNATGQSADPNHGDGISIFSSFNSVGGTDPGAGNLIAFNSQSGVVVNLAIGNQILGNSIFNNSQAGIELQNGGNFSMPPPQLSYVVESSSSKTDQIQVGGILSIPPGGSIDGNQLTCTVQVFGTLNGMGSGQGQIFLGSTQITTNNSGFAIFTLRDVTTPADAGMTFTATATSPENNDVLQSGNTSAFSNVVDFGTANQAYVANVYQLLLSRVPDPSSSVWVSDLDNGAAPASVVLAIQGSAEYLNDQVAAMYNLYLHRNPDTAGGQYWVSFLQAGGTFEEVAAGLTSSQEYFVLEGGTNQGFITGLYEEILNRSASNAEIAGWETVLDNGASRFDVSFAFLTSQEYRTDLVQAYYMTFLLRPADSGGLAAWVNALNAGATDQQVLAGLFGSAEGYQLWS